MRAQHLQMASRDAARLAEAPMHEADAADPVRQALSEFPSVIAAGAHEHQLKAHPNDVRPPEEVKATHDAAAAARKKLSRWSKMDFGAAVSRVPDDFDDDELAFEGSSEAARREYSAAASIDQRLTKSDPEAYERIHQNMANAQAIDAVSGDQKRVTAQTSGEDATGAPQVAGREREVAEQIKKLEGSGGDLPQADD